MKFEDLSQHLERLHESEIKSIYKSAGSDKKYMIQVAGLIVACLCAISILSFAVPAFYGAYAPPMATKLFLLVVVLSGIWLSVKLLYRLNQSFYNSAVMRQINLRKSAGES